MTRELAETVAIQALGFIAEEPERLQPFLALTGIEAQSLRDAAREPNFLLGVLDYLAGDDALLAAFAGDAAIEPGSWSLLAISLLARRRLLRERDRSELI